MAVGCGAKCAKLILIVFNIIFWLSGAAILAIGIWFRVDPSIVNRLELIKVDANDSLLVYASYVIIGIGAFVFVVGFLGCCGAIKENTCMLGLYIFFLVIVMLGELAAGILTLIYKDRVTKDVVKYLTGRMKMDYKAPADLDAFSQAVDFAQLTGSCCGVTDKTDYLKSNYTTSSGNMYPMSCCKLKDPKNEPDAAKLVDPKPETKALFVDTDKCMAGTDTASINGVGCKDSLLKWFEERSVIIIGVGIGIACLELFGLIFAVCLCRNVGDKDD